MDEDRLPAETTNADALKPDGTWENSVERREEAAPPGDIPWRLVHSVICAGGPSDASFDDLGPPYELSPAVAVDDPFLTSIGDLLPSASVFYHVVPRAETVDAYPNERVVMLKVAATLTGMRATTAAGGGAVLPCVGATVDVDLGWSPRDGEAGDCDKSVGRTDGLYVRDVHPKHQEAVVHELLGRETIDRVSGEIATTKSMNVSGNVAYRNVSLGFGANETGTVTARKERSDKRSRETEVNNIYHVLTAYHLGQAGANFSIQPRPFEGEEWELIRGYRLVEGIQEFMLVVSVPLEAYLLHVKVGMNLGLRGELAAGVMLPRPPDPPPVEGQDVAIYARGGYPLLGVFRDPWRRDWAQYIEQLKAYMEIAETMQRAEIHLAPITTSFSGTGCAPLYWGADPCDDAGPSDPCTPERPLVEKWWMPNTVYALPYFIVGTAFVQRMQGSPEALRGFANAAASKLFDAINHAKRARRSQGSEPSDNPRPRMPLLRGFAGTLDCNVVLDSLRPLVHPEEVEVPPTRPLPRVADRRELGLRPVTAPESSQTVAPVAAEQSSTAQSGTAAGTVGAASPGPTSGPTRTK